VTCMDDLNRALGDISSIRQQIARTTEFRGYGPVTLCATGIFAISAAAAQALWVPDPAKHITSYLSIWIVTALVSAVLIGVQTVTRAHRMHSGIANEMIYMAVEQFLPAAGTGALLTLVLVQYASSAMWMLPGLWQLIFSLGVFSSCRFLPRAMVAAGMWYLLAGLTCIALGESRAFSPWTMGVSFGAGQFLAAGILFVSASEGSNET
jgi:hypothetical protein